MKVLIAVTHLLGTGHLARALTIGRAFARAGHAVTIASGGMAAPQLDARGLRFEQLPPLRSDGTDFTRLLDETGSVAGTDVYQRRRAALTNLVAEIGPDVVMTELFPFGRRVLSDEFLALIAAAEALLRRPVILSSIRDILNPPSKPDRAARAEALVIAHYDAVLVHADPAVTPLEASWPVTDMLRPRLRYTGFVAPPPPAPHPGCEGAGEILVSAGGGPVGQALFHCAASAAAQDKGRRWRLLTGASLDDVALPANVRVEPPRPDFRAMLAGAAASVSFCGYNTAMDLLQTGVPAVLVPFDDGGEVEQGLRAHALGRLPGMQVVTAQRLSPEALLDALARATADPRRDLAAMRFDGADQTVAIATQLAAARP